VLAGVVGVAVLVAAVLGLTRSFSPARHGPAAPDPFGEAAPPVGHPAPDFALPLFSGGTLDLRALRGKPVLLNFWASWCAPCREETPLLVRLHKVYGPRGVVFVGIDAEDQPAEARRFMAEYHVDYAVARAEDESLMDAYAVPGLPTSVSIGADGIVVGKYVGGFVGPEGRKNLTQRLDHLLAPPRP